MGGEFMEKVVERGVDVVKLGVMVWWEFVGGGKWERKRDGEKLEEMVVRFGLRDEGVEEDEKFVGRGGLVVEMEEE